MESLALLCTLHADGPTTLKRLRRAGCRSLADLENLGVERLAGLLEVTPAVARRLGREARVLRERLDLTGESALLEREEAPEPLTGGSTSDLPVESELPTEGTLGRRDRAIVDEVLVRWREEEAVAPPARVEAPGPMTGRDEPTPMEAPAPAAGPVQAAATPTPTLDLEQLDVLGDVRVRGARAALPETQPVSTPPASREPRAFTAPAQPVRAEAAACDAATAQPEMAQPATDQPAGAALLGAVDGLDEGLVVRLAAAGVTTLSGLASADCSTLAASTGVAFGTLRRIQFLARRREDSLGEDSLGEDSLDRTPAPEPIPQRAEAVDPLVFGSGIPAAKPAEDMTPATAEPITAAPLAGTPGADEPLTDAPPVELAFGAGLDAPAETVPLSLAAARPRPRRTAEPWPVDPGFAVTPSQPAAPEAPAPEAAIPEAAIPEAATPEAATPEAATPEAAIPNPAAVPPAPAPVQPAPQMRSNMAAMPGAGQDPAPEAPSAPSLSGASLSGSVPSSPIPSSPAAAPEVSFAPVVPPAAPAAQPQAPLPSGGMPVDPPAPRRPFWEARAQQATPPAAAEPVRGPVEPEVPIYTTPVGTWSQGLEPSAEAPVEAGDTLGWDFVIPGPDEAPAPQAPATGAVPPGPPADEDVAGPFA